MIVQYPPIYIVAENNQANGGNNRFVYGKKSTGNISDDNGTGIGSVAHYEMGVIIIPINIRFILQH